MILLENANRILEETVTARINAYVIIVINDVVIGYFDWVGEWMNALVIEYEPMNGLLERNQSP